MPTRRSGRRAASQPADPGYIAMPRTGISVSNGSSESVSAIFASQRSIFVDADAAGLPRLHPAPRRSCANPEGRCPRAWSDEVLHRPGLPSRPDRKLRPSGQARLQEPAPPASGGRLPHRHCARSAAPSQRRRFAPTWRAGAVVRSQRTFISISVLNEQRLHHGCVRNGRTIRAQLRSGRRALDERTAGVWLT